MEVQAVVFDTDGMIVIRPLRFSDRFSEEFGVSPGLVNEFFVNEFQDCLVGRRDLKEELAKVAPRWGWNHSLDQLIGYWFDGESDVDQRVLDQVMKLRRKGIKCYLSTNNEKYRVHHLTEELGLKNYFDGILSASDLGYTKASAEFWTTAHERIGSPPKEAVVVWDDDEVVVQVVREFGFSAFRYTTFEDHIEQTSILLGEF